MTFKKYLELGLSRNAFGDTPESDFAQDALRDKTFRDYEEWEEEEMQSHILVKGGCPEAVAAATKLFRKWKAA